MGELFESVATLRFFGDDLIPDRISEMLGAYPTSSSCKGDLIKRTQNSRGVKAPTGAWRLTTARLCPGDLDHHVSEIFSNLTDNLNVWAALTGKFEGNIFFGLFLKTYNEGVSLSPESLQAGDVRGLTFDFDMYGSEVYGAP